MNLLPPHHNTLKYEYNRENHSPLNTAPWQLINTSMKLMYLLREFSIMHQPLSITSIKIHVSTEEILIIYRPLSITIYVRHSSIILVIYKNLVKINKILPCALMYCKFNFNILYNKKKINYFLKMFPWCKYLLHLQTSITENSLMSPQKKKREKNQIYTSPNFNTPTSCRW